MMSSEFLKDADAYQPFVNLVHFEAACKPRSWTIPKCVILFTHLDEFMTNLESPTLNRKDFKQYFPRFWGEHNHVWEVKSIVKDRVRKVASEQDRDVIVFFLRTHFSQREKPPIRSWISCSTIHRTEIGMMNLFWLQIAYDEADCCPAGCFIHKQDGHGICIFRFLSLHQAWKRFKHQTRIILESFILNGGCIAKHFLRLAPHILNTSSLN